MLTIDFPSNPNYTVARLNDEVTYQSLNCRNPFHNIGFIYFCLKNINIMFRKTFTSSSHEINLSVINSSFVVGILKISILLKHCEKASSLLFSIPLTFD